MERYNYNEPMGLLGHVYHPAHPPKNHKTNFGNLGPILLKLGGEVLISVINSILEYGMAGVTFSPPQPPETVAMV